MPLSKIGRTAGLLAGGLACVAFSVVRGGEPPAQTPVAPQEAVEKKPEVATAEKIEELFAALKETKAKVVLVNVWSSG